jgi:hypothetical protein
VGNAGIPHARFQHAIERGQLLFAEAAARELGSLSLAHALEFLLLLAEKEPQRFDQAAARWHARFVLESRGVGIADSQLLLGAVAGLNDVATRVQVETIALLAQRYRVSSVVMVARRRLDCRRLSTLAAA